MKIHWDLEVQAAGMRKNLFALGYVVVVRGWPVASSLAGPVGWSRTAGAVTVLGGAVASMPAGQLASAPSAGGR